MPITFIKPKDKSDSHFETSSDYGIALGSSKGSNGATLVMIPGHGNKVYSRTDVQRINHLPDSKAPDPSRKPIIKEGNEGDIEITFQSPSDDLDDMDESTATTHGTMGFALFLNPSTLPTSSPIQQTHPTIPNLPGHIERERPRTRNKGIQAVKYVNAVKASPVALATKAMPRTDRNPTLAQAEKSTTWDLWQTAIGMEMNMLKGMNSYDLITRSQVPRGCQLLQSKMDLKTKVDAMGNVTKRKARLVALGNLEWESIRDTYAPTVNAKTINLILALAAQERMILCGLDIFGAFLNAEIGETVYVHLPERLRTYDAHGEEHV